MTTGTSYTLDATTDQIVIINKVTGSATAVHFPASPLTGMLYTLKDGKGDAATHNITITPASGTIDGQTSLIICANYAAVNLVYSGTEWNIV